MIERVESKHSALRVIGYREARGHAVLLAIVLWVAAAVITFATPGMRGVTGRLKGTDFIQFYTLGHLAFRGEYPRLATADALHRLQVGLVPASEPEFYFPVYPPQTALFFAPFARLPYGIAAAVWASVLVCAYAAIVWRTWQSVRDVLPDKTFLIAAAAAFPPFWNMVLYGQTTIFLIAAFFLCWLALEANRPVLAGVALGLLAIKPQFGLVVAAVVVATGQWRLAWGASCAISAQLLAVAGTMGFQALTAYYETVRGIPRIEHLLEPNPWQMHSLRSLTNLVPGRGATVLWVALSIAVIALVIVVWRAPVPLDTRLGVLVAGTVLVNPHLIVYDATVLILPLLWLGGWIERERPAASAEFWLAVYALFVFFLLPTARIIYIQISVVVLGWIFWRICRLVTSESTTPFAQVRQ